MSLFLHDGAIFNIDDSSIKQWLKFVSYFKDTEC